VKVGGADPEVAFPNRVFAATLLNEKLRAGVLVAVATLVVNRGERLPALKLVTEPEPPPQVVKAHAEPVYSKQPLVRLGRGSPNK